MGGVKVRKMFARIIPVKDDKVTINGKTYSLEEAIDKGLVNEVGVDDAGNKYVVIKQ